MSERFIPEYKGEVPTLGYAVGNWIEQNLVVPSGLSAGEPVVLYEDQWRFLLKHYQLDPKAPSRDKFGRRLGRDAFKHAGSMYIDVQKKGKSAFFAMIVAAEALGPATFDGWDENGRPVGIAHPSPFIQVLGSVKEQSHNIYRPLQFMLEKMEDFVEGLDSGATRIKLPNGEIVFTTSKASSRLGQPITCFVATESQLFTEENGLVDTANTLVRNVTGMGGRWLSDTNAYSPIENSWAQQVHESEDADIYVQYKDPMELPVIDTKHPLYDPEDVYEAIEHAYNDSLTHNGGHVSSKAIFSEITRKTTGTGKALRFFLNHITSMEEDVVDGRMWRERICQPENVHLEEGARIALGFDGSFSQDSTVLAAFDVDKKIVYILAAWERPKGFTGEWTVPRNEVDAAVRNAYSKYHVGILLADPFMWQTYLDSWEAEFGNVVDLQTNQQKRFDEVVTRFQVDLYNGDLYHPDDAILNRHLANAVLKDGNLKASAGPEGRPVFYKIVRKRKHHLRIDAVVSAMLAVHGGGMAIEKEMFDRDVVADPFMFELGI